MAALLREIESLGKDSGVSLSEVKPLFGTPDEANYEHALEIRYEGTLQQWVRFIHLLETSKSLFEIERATLALKEEGSDQLEGSLRLGNIIIQGLPQVPESSTETEGKQTIQVLGTILEEAVLQSFEKDK